jgi:hypothetical protein
LAALNRIIFWLVVVVWVAGCAAPAAPATPQATADPPPKTYAIVFGDGSVARFMHEVSLYGG